jgi:2-oxoglutarate ferredoxin oxidoreductase subunit delta
MNRLSLNTDYCKGCLICVEVCPKQAIKSSGKINAKGHVMPAEADMSRCTGCQLCEIVCPDFAIAIGTEAPESEGTECCRSTGFGSSPEKGRRK